mmetsp:Transcript_36867/g.78229  ORF Transcript_36867/g.78229 Transcript_36867/m.78229 type:complete len:201 (+) Transcript_36867:39-641(+)
MAWHTAFDIEWSQRIEKEESAFLAAEEKAGKLTKDDGLKKSRRHHSSGHRHHHHHRRSPSSPVLSGAGSQAMSAAGSEATHATRSSRASRSSSLSKISRTSSDSRASLLAERKAIVDTIPKDMQGACQFLNIQKDLLTQRVATHPEGKVGKMRFEPEQVVAPWWPLRGTYTNFHPVFTFEDPPAWTPDDILKFDGKTRRR